MADSSRTSRRSTANAVLDGDTAYLSFARDDLPPEVDDSIRELMRE